MVTEQERVVLYIEDNPDYAELVLRGLERHGLTRPVVHLEDGEAALDYLRRTLTRQERRPYLILLDLQLPKVDGVEVLRTIKQTDALADIPVVVLTTSAKDDDVAAAYSHSVNSYLVKPDDFPRFDALIRDLRSYWLGWNRQPEGDEN